MRIRLKDIGGHQLQGRVNGMKHFAEVCRRAAAATPGEMIILDFEGINYVTGSWLNAMLVPLFQWAARRENDFFPILANMEDDWLDELRLVAEWSHQCYLVCRTSADAVDTAQLVGGLESAQAETLKVLLKEGETTGASLARSRPHTGIGATAWNNRLGALHERRLVIKRKQGRESIYSPLIAEVIFNG